MKTNLVSSSQKTKYHLNLSAYIIKLLADLKTGGQEEYNMPEIITKSSPMPMCNSTNTHIYNIYLIPSPKTI